MTETSEAADDRPTLLFVLGMGRSGTSALTRVIALCGATLPAGMLGANKGNERGYWEPRETIALNIGILRERGSGWWELAMPQGDESEPAKRKAHTAEIAAYLARLPASPLVVIKDLQIVSSTEMWFDAAAQSGFRVATVIALRNPEEVSASMQDHFKAPPEFAAALWLRANLLSERVTRGVPRVFVDYANLLGDWRAEVKRISATLGVELSTADDRGVEVDGFLTPDLRHKRYSGPNADRFGTDWISTTYEILRAAARDEPIDTVALDTIRGAYQASQHDFQVAFDFVQQYRARAKLLMRPSIVKAIGEFNAIARLRKGTWA